MSDAAALSAITENGMPSSLELPGSEPRALVERPRLPHPDMLDEASLAAEPDRPERRPVAARRQRTGVAMRQRARARPQQRDGVLGHAPAALHFFRVDLPRALRGRIISHPIERPREVDGGGSRRPQHAIRLVEVMAELGRQRVAVGGGDADRRRAANSKRPDRLGHLRRAPALELHLFAGKSPLVEQDDAFVFQPDDLLRKQRAGHVYGSRSVVSSGKRR